MRVTLVVAAALNGVIGAGGAIPWRLSDDLKRFKALTLGKPVVMGRKTFESIGKPLPGRPNIVITRSETWNAFGAERASGVEEALRLAGRHGPEAMIIGGAEIYALALPLADRIHFTRVLATVAGDARFPPINHSAWRKIAAGGAAQGPRNEHPCRYFILERIR